MTLSKHCIHLLLITVFSTSSCLAVEIAYVVQRREILMFDKSGSLINSFPVTNFVHDIAVNTSGEVFLRTTDSSSSPHKSVIEKYDPLGNFLGNLLIEPTSVLGDIAIGRDGNLYVGRNTGNDTIERYTQAGTPLGTFSTISTPPPGAPFAIVFDSTDNMYVTDSDLVERFDTNGQSLGTFATIAPTTSFIYDLAIDSLDNLYTVTYEDKIEIFDPSGTSLLIFDPQIDTGSIAIDSDDILYVAGGGSGSTLGSIEMFQSDGTPLGTFVSGLSEETSDIIFATIVPEPSTIMLLVSGLLLGFRKRIGPRRMFTCGTQESTV